MQFLVVVIPLSIYHKCLINCTISNSNDPFLVLDLKNFYYNTSMTRYKYMKIYLDIIPEEIILKYNLRYLASNGWVYMEIRKGVPGLKQAGRIFKDRLQSHLANFG